MWVTIGIWDKHVGTESFKQNMNVLSSVLWMTIAAHRRADWGEAESIDKPSHSGKPELRGLELGQSSGAGDKGVEIKDGYSHWKFGDRRGEEG